MDLMSKSLLPESTNIILQSLKLIVKGFRFMWDKKIFQFDVWYARQHLHNLEDIVMKTFGD